MIFFFADGRLGNQIFQYAFLKSIQKNNEKIIVSGFEELKEVFEINDLVNINKKNKYLRFLLYRIIVPKILEPLAEIGIFKYIKQQYKNYDQYKIFTNNYSVKDGFINKIKFIKLGFFQSESFFNKDIVNKLDIKAKYIIKAKNFLNNIDNYKVFVHIRRTDYLNLDVLGERDLSLPVDYYKSQIDWFYKNKKDVQFIFLGDDTAYIKNHFNYLNNKIISENNSVETDLAIMTMCNSAIISNSSLAWWGAYLMKKRERVFAPKYWLGFKKNIEYPQGISLSFAEKVNIICRNGNV